MTNGSDNSRQAETSAEWARLPATVRHRACCGTPLDGAEVALLFAALSRAETELETARKAAASHEAWAAELDRLRVEYARRLVARGDKSPWVAVDAIGAVVPPGGEDERATAMADYARVTTALNDSIAREGDLLGRAERAEAVVERMRDQARRARTSGSAGRACADVIDEAIEDAERSAGGGA